MMEEPGKVGGIFRGIAPAKYGPLQVRSGRVDDQSGLPRR